MDHQFDTLLSEQRRFPPSPDFAADANATSALFDQANADRLAFWAEQARMLDWMEPWQSVLEWTPPHAKWFSGGRLNVAANCLDRHLKGPAATRQRSSSRASRATAASTPTGIWRVKSAAAPMP
jgi:acetyl-CoA synthetase